MENVCEVLLLLIPFLGHLEKNGIAIEYVKCEKLLFSKQNRIRIEGNSILSEYAYTHIHTHTMLKKQYFVLIQI